MAPAGGFCADGRFQRQRRIVTFAAADADGGRGMEQMRVLRCNRRSPFTKRRNIVENPESAPVRRDHQVVAMNHEVADRTDRQIILQRLPVIAIVKRNVNAQFRSSEKQSLAPGSSRTACT